VPDVGGESGCTSGYGAVVRAADARDPQRLDDLITGKNLNLRVANVMAFEGDRISSVHIYFDPVEFLGQLGLMPAPG
jgi:hypothetical protein